MVQSCFHPACRLRNTSERGITKSKPPDWGTYFSAPCTDMCSEERVDCWSCGRWYFALHTNGQLQSDIWPLDIHLVSCVQTKASKNKTKTSKGCNNGTAFPMVIIATLGYGYASACPKILPVKFADGVICTSQSTLLSSHTITHILLLKKKKKNSASLCSLCFLYLCLFSLLQSNIRIEWLVSNS